METHNDPREKFAFSSGLDSASAQFARVIECAVLCALLHRVIQKQLFPSILPKFLNLLLKRFLSTLSDEFHGYMRSRNFN